MRPKRHIRSGWHGFTFSIITYLVVTFQLYFFAHCVPNISICNKMMLVAIIIQLCNLEYQKYDRASVTWPPGPATPVQECLC